MRRLSSDYGVNLNYLILIISAFLFITGNIYSQGFLPDEKTGYQLISEDLESGRIFSKYIKDSIKIVLQVIDLRKAKADFILGSLKNMGNWDGVHTYNNPVNPQFEKLNFDSAYNIYHNIYGDDIISVTNGAFFETDDKSSYTPIAYPLKYSGEIISSGVSPFAPKTGNYPLKVISFEDSSVSISDFNYENGNPLNNGNSLNQIVTLNYQNHPNVIEFARITEGVENRYHLITAIDLFGSREKETLFIISSGNEISIYQLAKELKKLSSKIIDEEILTLDGGSSVSVQDKYGKDIIKPVNGIKVPMYIAFRRVPDQNHKLSKFRIMNPQSGDTLKSNEPYFIMWISNEKVSKVELYQDESLIAQLGLNKTWDGLFVWTPDPTLQGDNYRIKISNNSSWIYSSCFSIINKK